MLRLNKRLTTFSHLRFCGLALLLAGCAQAPAPQGINDPLEPLNRTTHSLNKALDRAIVSPAADGYGALVPQRLRTGISNVADTLDLPGDVVNHLLQGRVDHAVTNTLRFGMNLTFGLGGTIDFSTAIGLPREDTDFGQTLHVWGVGEGPYFEIPGLGPSTVRDTVGTAVDIVLNPVGNWVSSKDEIGVTAAKLLSRLNDRTRYSSTVDSILYESEDSYAQARLLYLQNRRFELGQTAGDAPDDDFIDPYEDF